MVATPYDDIMSSDDPAVLASLEATMTAPEAPEPAYAAPVPAEAPAIAEPAPVETPPAEVPTPVETPAPVTPTPAEDPLAKVAERYRTGRMTPVQQLTTRYMAENPDMAPEDCAALAREDLGLPAVTAASAAPAQQQAETTPTDPDAPEIIRAPETVAEIEARVAELKETLLTEADDGLDSRQKKEHEFELIELTTKLTNARLAEANAQQSQQDSFMQARNASLAAAKALHPDAANPNSALGQEIARVMAEMPDTILDRKDAPMVVTREAMANLGLTPVRTAPTNGSTPQPAAQQPVPAAPVIVPPVLPGGTRGAGAPVVTMADLSQTLEDMSADELTAVLARPTGRGRLMPILR